LAGLNAPPYDRQIIIAHSGGNLSRHEFRFFQQSDYSIKLLPISS
jgi:hypothetical protein